MATSACVNSAGLFEDSGAVCLKWCLVLTACYVQNTRSMVPTFCSIDGVSPLNPNKLPLFAGSR
jgi:hypothetical protein